MADSTSDSTSDSTPDPTPDRTSGSAPRPKLDLVVRDCPDALALATFDTDVLRGTAEPAVLAAGATVHDHQPSKARTFKVRLDPAGHPFGLTGQG